MIKYFFIIPIVFLTGCTTGSKTRIDYKHYVYTAPSTQTFIVEKETEKPVFIPRERPVYIYTPSSSCEEPTITDLSKEISRKMAKKARAAWYAN